MKGSTGEGRSMNSSPRTAYRTPSQRQIAVGTSIDSHRLSNKDKISICIVFICLAAMNITPVLNVMGAPLALLCVVVAVFNPYAAFLYTAGSQIAPDPPMFPLTLAQLFVASWVFTLPINNQLGNFAAVPRSLRFIIPFIVLHSLITLDNGSFSEPLLYASINAAILCFYLPRVSGNFTGLVLMLGLGASLGIVGHWGGAIGLPVSGEVYDHSGIRGGIRAGSGRADVNFASVNVGFALWTLAAILLPIAWAKRGRKRPAYNLLILTLLAACAIPLIAMGSRGGLAYLVLGGLILYLYAMNVRSLSGSSMKFSAFAIWCLIPTLPFLWPLFLETGPGKVLMATLEYNEEQSTLSGGNLFLAGRWDIWSHSWAVVQENLWFGTAKGTVVDMGEYGVFVVGGEIAEGAGQGAAGHNMFLDLAMTSGVPMAILFAIAFAAPVIALIRRRGLLYAQPFVIAHVMCLLPMLNLSILNWKTYWALHVLTSFAAMRAPNKRKPFLTRPPGQLSQTSSRSIPVKAPR